MDAGGNNIKDPNGMEKYSRRYKNGVDIIEREKITGRETEESADRDDSNDSSPRIVINDAPTRSHLFIAKSRSQLTEVDNLLRSIMNRPMNSR